MINIEGFKDELKSKSKIEPTLQVLIKDEEGTVIAEVDKLIYIRKKN